MKPGIVASRLFASALAALGFTIGVALLGAAPASAQETPQETPWYMPQPWVHPPQTGPNIRKLPGYYGHNDYDNRAYGSFANYCYGDCGELPGTVATRGGVILSQPVVAIFDPRDYLIVPRGQYQAPQAATTRRATAPARPAVVPVDVATPRPEERLPKFSMQNGVRIIRPSPVTTY